MLAEHVRRRKEEEAAAQGAPAATTAYPRQGGRAGGRDRRRRRRIDEVAGARAPRRGHAVAWQPPWIWWVRGAAMEACESGGGDGPSVLVKGSRTPPR